MVDILDTVTADALLDTVGLLGHLCGYQSNPSGGWRKATALFNARITRSRFMRLLTPVRQGLRSMPERGPSDDPP